jgi:hypothetical protein
MMDAENWSIFWAWVSVSRNRKFFPSSAWTILSATNGAVLNGWFCRDFSVLGYSIRETILAVPKVMNRTKTPIEQDALKDNSIQSSLTITIETRKTG